MSQANKLNGLSLSQAKLLKDALILLCPQKTSEQEDAEHLISQLDSIIKYYDVITNYVKGN